MDEALAQAGAGIGNRINSGTIVAVLGFESMSESLTMHIINEITSSIMETGNLRLLTRDRVEAIVAEHEFVFSELVDDNERRRAGRMLGADVVITGRLTGMGKGYRLNVQCLEVTSGFILFIRSFDIKGNDRRIRGLAEGGDAQDSDPNLFTTLSIMGYNLHLGANSWGFTVGLFGLYTTWNFGLPTDFLGYEKATIGGSGIYYRPDGSTTKYENTSSYLDKTAHSTWGGLLGYSFNVLEEFLFLSVGFGVRSTLEYRLYDLGTGNPVWLRPSSARTGSGAELAFAAEAGLLFKIGFVYLSTSYRYIAGDPFNVTVGAGIAGMW